MISVSTIDYIDDFDGNEVALKHPTFEGEEPVVCDNCIEDGNRITIVDGEMFHRCRANEASCVDGTACPDYIEQCACDTCHIKEGT